MVLHTVLTEVKGLSWLDLITLGFVFSDGGSKVETTIIISLSIHVTADTGPLYIQTD